MSWTSIFAGVAAFTSVVNVLVTIVNNKAQMRAQIIASSRVQWIKEVRNIYTNFLKLSTEFHNELLFLVHLFSFLITTYATAFASGTIEKPCSSGS